MTSTLNLREFRGSLSKLLSSEASGLGQNFLPLFDSVYYSERRDAALARYSPNYGVGQAAFYYLCPGVIMMRCEGRYASLEIANQSAAANFIIEKAYSLRLYERGNSTIHVGGATENISAYEGALCCYHHANRIKNTYVLEKNHSFIHFVFTDQGLYNVLKQYKISVPSILSSWKNQDIPRSEIFKFDMIEELIWIYQSLRPENLFKEGSQRFMQMKFAELMYNLSDLICEKLMRSSLPSGYLDRDVRLAKRLVDVGAIETTSVQAVAKMVGLSTRKLTEKFQTEHGVSMAKYIQIKRLNLAKKWLHEEGASVSEVAARCGYSETGNFSRAFKKYFGHSPTDRA